MCFDVFQSITFVVVVVLFLLFFVLCVCCCCCCLNRDAMLIIKNNVEFCLTEIQMYTYERT